MTQEILVVNGLRKYFPIRHGLWGRKVGDIKAVDGVSFSMSRKGEVFGLVGESGSGKSTVAYTILGIHQATAGEIWFEGENFSKANKKQLQHLRERAQLVFQNPNSTLNPRRTVKQALLLPLRAHNMCANSRDRIRRIGELLEMVELPASYMHKYPYALSGGEIQRIAITRVLALNPSLVILDEPTSALDVSVQGNIILLLLSLRDRFGLSYLFITHDLSLIRNIASSVGVMYLGQICETGSTADLFVNPLHPYTKMLLSSIPVMSQEEEELKPEKLVSEGEVPNPANVPSGCGFHPRCSQKMDTCFEKAPRTVDVGKGHRVRCHIYG